MSKHVTKKVDSVITTGYNLLIGGIILMITGIVAGGHFDTVTGAGIVVMAYLALLSAVAFTLWTILLKYNKIGRICIYNFVIPVSGIFLAGIVLHEDIWHLRYFSALLLVSAGIVIVNITRGNNKKKSGSESSNA